MKKHGVVAWMLFECGLTLDLPRLHAQPMAEISRIDLERAPDPAPVTTRIDVNRERSSNPAFDPARFSVSFVGATAINLAGVLLSIWGVGRFENPDALADALLWGPTAVLAGGVIPLPIASLVAFASHREMGGTAPFVMAIVPNAVGVLGALVSGYALLPADRTAALVASTTFAVVGGAACALMLELRQRRPRSRLDEVAWSPTLSATPHGVDFRVGGQW